ncbi:hypothetical protein KA005_07805, partial [bacterium]|nr:hypothetical protein [bacterium]
MALTINTHPDDVITNAPEFDVSTSLTEGPSYQNLRVRATIYVGGESEAIAILEQPKGLDDWNLFDILKAMTGKADVPMGAGFRYKSATVSAELLTGWTQDQGNFTTFSVSGRRIISAVTSGGGGYDYAKSNDLGSVVAGDVIMVGLQVSYNDSGTNPFQLVYTDGSAPFGDNVNRNRYAGLNSGECRQQQMYFMLVMEDAATPFIFLGNDNDSTNLGAQENTIRKITDFKDNPCVYFKVKFQEVYENASDVTTIGDTEYTDTLMFVPIVVRPGEEFTDYLITDAGATLTDKIATRNIDGDIKYPFEHDLEL